MFDSIIYKPTISATWVLVIPLHPLLLILMIGIHSMSYSKVRDSCCSVSLLGLFPAGDSLPSICIVENDCLTIITEEGDDYSVALPFPVSRPERHRDDIVPGGSSSKLFAVRWDLILLRFLK